MKNRITKEVFRLECGQELYNINIAYNTYGKLNQERSNVIWVCHALTGDQNVFDWWGGLFGPNKLFDPEDYFIVAVNALGSCYGSTGPSTPRRNQRPALLEFPVVSVRDQVAVNELVREHLKVDKVFALIGASFGGQIALEWSIISPNSFQKLVLVASNAKHSAFGVAFNESQRLALRLDPTFGTLHGGKDGLKAARSIAMLSYRSYKGYNNKLEAENDLSDQLPAITYQQYQGEKLAKRFDAMSYYFLSRTMDSHDVGRGRSGIKKALTKVVAEVLTVGVDTDLLFPTSEQKFIARHVRNGSYAEISSDYGHDGFLVETDQLEEVLNDFLFKDSQRFKQTRFKQILSNN